MKFTRVLNFALALLALAGCGVKGKTSSSSSSASVNADLDLDAAAYCYVPQVDGCGIGGTENVREALGTALQNVFHGVRKARLNVGRETFCRNSGAPDTDYAKFCRDFVEKHVAQYANFADAHQFNFLPRKNLPGGAQFMVYLGRGGTTHAIYYDHAAIASLVASGSSDEIEEKVGHELTHFLTVGPEVAAAGYIADLSTLTYPGGTVRGDLFATDLGRGFARIHREFTRYADVIRASNPLAYFRLRETSGIVASDASTNGRSAQYVGDVRRAVAGPLTNESDSVGVELAQSATQGAFVQSVLPEIESGDVSAVSVEFWMSPVANGNDGMPVSFQGSDLFFAGGKLGFNSLHGDLRGVPFTMTGQWSHVVAIWKNVFAENRLFVNGVEQSLTQGGTVGFTPFRDRRITFGTTSYADPKGVLYAFAGKIAEPAIYTRELSALEVFRDYSVGRGKWEVVPPTVTASETAAPSPAPPQSIAINLLGNPATKIVFTGPETSDATYTIYGKIYSTLSYALPSTTLLYKCWTSRGAHHTLNFADCADKEAARPLGYVYTTAGAGRSPLRGCREPGGAVSALVPVDNGCAALGLTDSGILAYTTTFPTGADWTALRAIYGAAGSAANPYATAPAALTSIYMSPANARLMSAIPPDASYVHRGGVTDCAFGLCSGIQSLFMQPARIPAPTSAISVIRDVYVSPPGQHYQDGGPVQPGYFVTGAFVDANGGTISGYQTIQANFVNWATLPSGAKYIVDIYTTEPGLRAPALSCGAGYRAVGAAADCALGVCSGVQTFCVLDGTKP